MTNTGMVTPISRTSIIDSLIQTGNRRRHNTTEVSVLPFLLTDYKTLRKVKRERQSQQQRRSLHPGRADSVARPEAAEARTVHVRPRPLTRAVSPERHCR